MWIGFSSLIHSSDWNPGPAFAPAKRTSSFQEVLMHNGSRGRLFQAALPLLFKRMLVGRTHAPTGSSPQFFDDASAVAVGVGLNADALEHGEPGIAERRVFLNDNVMPQLEPCPPAGDERGAVGQGQRAGETS